MITVTSILTNNERGKKIWQNNVVNETADVECVI